MRAFFPGPAFWGLINPEWSLCNKGRRQSPVNLDPEKLLYDPNLTELNVDKHRVSHLFRLRLLYRNINTYFSTQIVFNTFLNNSRTIKQILTSRNIQYGIRLQIAMGRLYT